MLMAGDLLPPFLYDFQDAPSNVLEERLEGQDIEKRVR